MIRLVAIVVVVVVVLVVLSTGFDYFHVGGTGCLFVHAGLAHVHLQCGSNIHVPAG
jgi:hypothetical protein